MDSQRSGEILIFLMLSVPVMTCCVALHLDPLAGPSLRSSGVKTSTVPPKRRRKRRTASVGSLSVKPTLTERQQLQLAMQLSSPVSSPVSCHEDKSSEKSKLSKRNDRGENTLSVSINCSSMECTYSYHHFT